MDYAAEQRLPGVPGAAVRTEDESHKFTTAVKITKEIIRLAGGRGEGFVATKVTAFGPTEPMFLSNSLVLQIDKLFAKIAGALKVSLPPLKPTLLLLLTLFLLLLLSFQAFLFLFLPLHLLVLLPPADAARSLLSLFLLLLRIPKTLL